MNGRWPERAPARNTDAIVLVTNNSSRERAPATKADAIVVVIGG
jgi:predicted Rossmann-fold nucleotide-binding protein